MGPLNMYFLLNMGILLCLFTPRLGTTPLQTHHFPRIPKRPKFPAVQAMAMTACPGRASRSSLPKPPPPKAKATPKVSCYSWCFFLKRFGGGLGYNGICHNCFRPRENQIWNMEVGYHGIRDNCFRAGYL